MNTSERGAVSFTVEAGFHSQEKQISERQVVCPFSENHCGPHAGSWVILLQVLLLVDANNPIVDPVQLDTCLLSLELFRAFPAKGAQHDCLCSIVVVFECELGRPLLDLVKLLDILSSGGVGPRHRLHIPGWV